MQCSRKYACFIFQAEATVKLEAEQKKCTQYSSEKEEMQGTDCLHVHSMLLNVVMFQVFRTGFFLT